MEIKNKINLPIIITAILGLSLTAQSCSLLGASGPKGIIYTNNSGEQWYQLNVVATTEKKTSQLLGNLNISKIVVAPDRNEVVYLVTPIGIFATDTGGQIWHHILPGFEARDISIASSDPSLLYAVGSQGGRGVVYKSVDRGVNWTQEFITPDGNPAWSVAIEPSDKTHVLVGLNSGLIISSEDGGQTWSPRTNLAGPVVQMQYSPRDPNLLFLLLRSQGLYSSTDRALTFRHLSAELERLNVRTNKLGTDIQSSLNYTTPSAYIQFDLINSGDNTIYLTTNTGIFRLDQFGEVVRPIRLPVDPRHANTIAIDATTGGDVVYVSIDSILYKSDNAGLTFATVKLPTSRLIRYIQVISDQPGSIYVGLTDQKAAY